MIDFVICDVSNEGTLTLNKMMQLLELNKTN
jgi:hypothetical protein